MEKVRRKSQFQRKKTILRLDHVDIDEIDKEVKKPKK